MVHKGQLKTGKKIQDLASFNRMSLNKNGIPCKMIQDLHIFKDNSSPQHEFIIDKSFDVFYITM